MDDPQANKSLVNCQYTIVTLIPFIFIFTYIVQPAAKEDGWDTEPFVLTTSKDGTKLFGRGSTDDKGPVLGWLHTIEAYQQTGLELVFRYKLLIS